MGGFSRTLVTETALSKAVVVETHVLGAIELGSLGGVSDSAAHLPGGESPFTPLVLVGYWGGSGVGVGVIGLVGVALTLVGR